LRPDGEGTGILRFGRLEGFFTGTRTVSDAFEQPEDEPVPLAATALNIVSSGGVARYAWGEDLGEYRIGDAYVDVLGADGVPIGAYPVWGVQLSMKPDGLGEGRSARIRGYASTQPHIGAEPVWDARRSSPPRQRNLWSNIRVGRREAWIEVAYLYHVRPGSEWRGGAEVREAVLDGQHVEDPASFFCAIGEALNGPGGYFGSNFMALSDCLRIRSRAGGLSLRLVWTSAEVAQGHLDRTANTGIGPMTYMEIALETLVHAGVDVILA
jgi:hypothetical protein